MQESRSIEKIVAPERESTAVSPPGRFSLGYRVRRKLRRWTNELRAQAAERAKAPLLLSAPVHLNLNHTTICNLRCTMCEQGLGGVPQRVMERGVYRRVRDELFDSVSEVSLTVMGDPFCAPKDFLDELWSDIERYDLRLEITTNALLLGDEAELERLLRLLRRIVISIDGATRETYERIRKPAKWARLCENVERLFKVRRSLPPWRRPVVHFNFVVMRSNYEELPDLVDLVARWGGNSVSGALLIAVDPAIAHEALDERDEHLRDVVAEARRRSVRHGIGFGVGGAKSDLAFDRRGASSGARERIVRIRSALRPGIALGANYFIERIGRRWNRAPRECPFLWSKIYVELDGTVGTCCHPRFYLTGDLKRDSMRDIWNGRRYRGLRASLNSEHPAASCRDCHLLKRQSPKH